MQVQRAVVWDLDGVIVDSASAHNAAWVELAQQYKVEYDPDRDFLPYFGRHNTDLIAGLWGITDPEHVAAMSDTKEAAFRRRASGLKALPGTAALMEALKRGGWRQAVGSSAPLENILVTLEGTGLGGYIETIVSAADVPRGKPDPEVFRLAFKRLGVAPRDGVVIEDSLAGVRAGVAAGAATLGVTNTQPEHLLKEAGAARVVHSLEAVAPADLEELVTLNRGRG